MVIANEASNGPSPRRAATTGIQISHDRRKVAAKKVPGGASVMGNGMGDFVVPGPTIARSGLLMVDHASLVA
jgi:hypothetical protein